MSKTGISHPSVLDLVTRDEDTVRLVLVEEAALSNEDAPALQEKMNNYLGYAIDGELSRQHPDSRNKQVVIRVDLYAQPSAFILEFIARYREAISQYQVQVKVSIEGEVAL